MSGVHFDYDPETKIQESITTGDNVGDLVIQSVQDCSDVVEYNALHRGRLDKSADWWFVGSIPMATCMRWARESGTRPFSRDWQTIAKRHLQDPDYSKLNVNRIKL